MPIDVASEPQAANVQKLIKQHGGRLRDQETIVAACRGGAIDRVQPSTVFGLLGSFGRSMQESLSEDKLTERAGQIQLFLHRKGLSLIDFVGTKDGYNLALTQERVLVFNLTARRLLSESPVRGMHLERLHHASGRSTLFFCEGRKAAAVTSWEDPEITDAFVAAYRELQDAAFHQQAS